MIGRCKKCGAVFSGTDGAQICGECRIKTAEEFEKVKKFLREFPGKSIDDVERETGVSRDDIMIFMREGRLVYAPKKAVLSCERCGVSIERGRLCPSCLKLIEKVLSNGNKEHKPEKETAKTGLHIVR